MKGKKTMTTLHLRILLYWVYEYNFLFQIGTYTISISAKAMNKPFYVVAESFKFARFYPLNQRDVPNEFKVSRLQLIVHVKCFTVE